MGGFNWKGAARGMLGGMSNRYKIAQEDQREFERYEKMQNVQMMKQKEMATWQSKQNKQAALDQRELTKQYAEEDRGIKKRWEEEDAPGLLQKKIETEDTLSDAATEREFKKADAKMAKLFPELEPGSPEYLQKQRELAGVANTKKGMTQKEISDADDKINEIVKDEFKDLTEPEAKAMFGNKVPKGFNSALSALKQRRKDELWADKRAILGITEGGGGGADAQARIIANLATLSEEELAKKISMKTPEEQQQIRDLIAQSKGGTPTGGMLSGAEEEPKVDEKAIMQRIAQAQAMGQPPAPEDLAALEEVRNKGKWKPTTPESREARREAARLKAGGQ